MPGNEVGTGWTPLHANTLWKEEVNEDLRGVLPQGCTALENRLPVSFSCIDQRLLRVC